MEEAKDGGVMDDGDGVKRSARVHSSKREQETCLLGRVQSELPDPANSFRIELQLLLHSGPLPVSNPHG